MDKLHNLEARLQSSQLISDNELKEIKGGKRFTTTSYSQFAAKRDSLQRAGVTIRGIVHCNNHYCIEW